MEIPFAFGDLSTPGAAKGPIAVTLNTAYLEEEVEADILGKELDENGGLTDAANDDPPYIAIGGRAESARGGYEYFWIYRMKLAPAEENKETKQETPTYQTPNLSGEALPRLHDGLEKYKMWIKAQRLLIRQYLMNGLTKLSIKIGLRRFNLCKLNFLSKVKRKYLPHHLCLCLLNVNILS